MLLLSFGPFLHHWRRSWGRVCTWSGASTTPALGYQRTLLGKGKNIMKGCLEHNCISINAYINLFYLSSIIYGIYLGRKQIWNNKEAKQKAVCVFRKLYLYHHHLCQCGVDGMQNMSYHWWQPWCICQPERWLALLQLTNLKHGITGLFILMTDSGSGPELDKTKLWFWLLRKLKWTWQVTICEGD